MVVKKKADLLIKTLSKRGDKASCRTAMIFTIYKSRKISITTRRQAGEQKMKI